MPIVPPDFFDAMSAEQMNDWYARTVGYRPQEDDPSMTEAELRALCKSVTEAYENEGTQP